MCFISLCVFFSLHKKRIEEKINECGQDQLDVKMEVIHCMRSCRKLSANLTFAHSRVRQMILFNKRAFCLHEFQTLQVVS